MPLGLVSIGEEQGIMLIFRVLPEFYTSSAAEALDYIEPQKEDASSKKMYCCIWQVLRPCAMGHSFLVCLTSKPC